MVEETEVDPHHGGGFYTLKNVRAGNNTFLDIEILITGGVASKHDQQLLDKWQTVSVKASKLLPEPNLAEKLIAPEARPLNTERLFSPP